MGPARNSIIRWIGIAKLQSRGLAFGDFLALLWRSLFRNEKMLIYALDALQIETEQKEATGSIEIRKAEISELESIEYYLKPLPWEFQCHQYDGVRDFFVGSNSGGIQHISWIYYQNDPNRFVRLGPDDAEIKYCLTLPEFRGQGIYPAVLKTIAGYLKEKGYRQVFICVSEDNRPSIRGIEKAGFIRVGQVRFRKAMGIQISRRYVPSRV